MDEIIIAIEPLAMPGDGPEAVEQARWNSLPVRRRRHQALEPARWGRTGMILMVVAALVLVVGWLGVWWAGSGDVQADVVPSGTVAAPPISSFDATKATTKDWTLYLRELYGNRAAALRTKNESLLVSVYTADSRQRESDEDAITALRASGGTLSGFAPELISVVTVTRTAKEIVVLASDLIPAYEVVVLGGGRQEVPLRGENSVTITLQPASRTWLISSIVRSRMG
ncbi:MAG: hypothetical protein ABI137_13970 [Antricoccus sp.]